MESAMQNNLNIQRIKDIIQEIQTEIVKANKSSRDESSKYNYSEFFSPLVREEKLEAPNNYLNIDSQSIIDKLSLVSQLLNEINDKNDLDDQKEYNRSNKIFIDTIEKLVEQRKNYVQDIMDYCLGPVRWSIHKCEIDREIAVLDPRRVELELSELEKVFTSINSNITERCNNYFPFVEDNISLSSILLNTISKYNECLECNIKLSLQGKEGTISTTYKFILFYLVQYYFNKIHQVSFDGNIEIQLRFDISDIELNIIEKVKMFDESDNTIGSELYDEKIISYYISLYIEYLSGDFIIDSNEQGRIYRIRIPFNKNQNVSRET